MFSRARKRYCVFASVLWIACFFVFFSINAFTNLIISHNLQRIRGASFSERRPSSSSSSSFTFPQVWYIQNRHTSMRDVRHVLCVHKHAAVRRRRWRDQQNKNPLLSRHNAPNTKCAAAVAAAAAVAWRGARACSHYWGNKKAISLSECD